MFNKTKWPCSAEISLISALHRLNYTCRSRGIVLSQRRKLSTVMKINILLNATIDQFNFIIEDFFFNSAFIFLQISYIKM